MPNKTFGCTGAGDVWVKRGCRGRFGCTENDLYGIQCGHHSSAEYRDCKCSPVNEDEETTAKRATAMFGAWRRVGPSSRRLQAV